MITHTQRRFTRSLTLIFTLAIAILTFSTALGAAQNSSVQISPTQEPVGPNSFQANPTEPPRVPNQLQANPTEVPRVPGDVQANPTEPPRGPDDVQANPTQVPTDIIDDAQANPTEPPEIDDEAIPTTGSVRVVKRDCPIGVPEELLLTEYLTICTEPHDGVEFVLNDVNSGTLGVTSGGQVEWIGVDPGVFNITEMIPAGYGDPIVHCGYTESPGGGVQHPALHNATGGVVKGTFPDSRFEFVCYWMNIPLKPVVEGPDDVANPGGGEGVADFLLFKRSCPSDIPPGQDVAYYLDHCTATLDGIEFTVTHGNGSSTKSVIDGEATWTGLPLGPFTVEEHIPVQFGDPMFFCGWTAFDGGNVYEAFSQLIESEDGVVEREITVPNTIAFCYAFNVQGGPGDFADPGSSLSSLVVRKWDCREGTPTERDRDYYIRNCELMLEPVEFTLTNADGSETRATSGGFAEWDLLPTGEFSLQETIPDGYLSPVAFCGWYAYWGGFHYDAFPLPVPSPGGLIEGEITVPNTDYFCDVVNIEGEIDDITANPTRVPTEAIDDVVANPTVVPTEEIDDITAETAGTVRLIKRDCPLGVPEDATLADYLVICTQHHNGVDFELETSDGTQAGTTAAGQVEWIGVPAGPFTITESIPSGYADPIAHCGFTESPGGGVQHPSLQDSTEGVIQGTLPEPPFEYVCYMLNIKSTGQFPTGPGGITQNPGDPDSAFTAFKLECPSGTPLDQETYWYLENCDDGPDGVLFTLTTDEGSSTKPIVNGTAVWEGLPLGPWTLEEDVPPLYGEPLIHCGWTALWEGIIYDAFAQLVPSSGGVVEGEITVPSTGAFCFVMNMQATPDSFESPQDTTNVLVARKWECRAGIKDNEPAEVDLQIDYYLRLCEQATEPVEFTLSNADGVSTQNTSGGKVEWDDVPLGEFTLQETIPAGYDEPKVFCGWTAFYQGAVYDGFHQPVSSTNGLIENEISVPNTHMLCHFFNSKFAADDLQANPTAVPEIDDVTANPADTTHHIRVRSAACPEGLNPTDSYWSGNDECAPPLNGLAVTLITESGSMDAVTSGNGDAEWTGVDLGPSGTIELQQEIPAGYGEPTVWCVSFPIAAGDAQDFEFFPATSVDGRVTVQPAQHEPFRFSCHYFNIPDISPGPVEPEADIEIDKSCPVIPDDPQVGDEITYQVTITNTGDVPLYDIDVIETREGEYDAPFPTELAPGDSATRTFTSEITPEDVLNGNVNNGAAVTGSGDVGASTTDLTVEVNVACAL